MFEFFLFVLFCAFCYFLVKGFVSLFKDRTSIKRNFGLALVFFFAVPFFMMTQLIGDLSSKSVQKSEPSGVNNLAIEVPKETELSRKPPPKSTEQLAMERHNRLQIDKNAIELIEARIAENNKYLKKYYATSEQLDQCAKDILHSAALKVLYENQDQNSQERELSNRALATIGKVEPHCRKLYASKMEAGYMKLGFDISFETSGSQDRTLTVQYALMSRPIIYKFQSEMELDATAKKIGFNKIIYSNGFQGDLGKIWTIDISK
jgi:hypothetical protein